MRLRLTGGKQALQELLLSEIHGNLHNLCGFSLVSESGGQGRDKIRFQVDRWWVNSSFQNLYPSLFQNSTVHNHLISYYAQLDRVSLIEGAENILGSRLRILQEFLVKSFFQSFFLDSSYPYFSLYQAIWEAPIPSRVQVFLWSLSFKSRWKITIDLITQDCE